MEDIIIKDGLIVDGTGKKPYKGSVIIRKGKIHKIISHSEGYTGAIEISAKNKIITPGFIDVSNHSDTYLTLFNAPSQKSLITQGVTTLIGGNCGSSLAPLISNSAIASIQKWSNIADININWHTMREYFTILSSKSFAPNIGTLVGYSTVRRGLIGDAARALTASELATITDILDKALSEGALGVSLGLAFSHMQVVNKAELIQLTTIVKKHNKILTVHTRNDGEKVLESIQEIIDITRKTQVKTHINHIKILGHKNWKYDKDIYTLLNQVQEENLPLTFDVFPYTANNTVAYILLPDWVSLGGNAVLLENLQDASIRRKVIQEMKANSYDYSRMIVSDSPMNKSILGKSIVEIAKHQDLGVEDALIQLIIASEGRSRVIVEAISEAHIRQFIQYENSIIGSDSAGYDDSLIRLKGYDHPRSFGAITKFLQDYVVSGKLSWEKAIPKITSLPAKVFEIDNRGLLQENKQADIVIIDPEKLESCATFQQPIQYSRGIEMVIVNGVVTLKDGEVIADEGDIII
jgi:N-acyl-D-amino-acid deacylase